MDVNIIKVAKKVGSQMQLENNFDQLLCRIYSAAVVVS